MNLPTKLIKDFATMANNSSVEEKPITQLYGTVKVVEDKKYVILDGSNSLTPISEIVDVETDDRVLVSIENHKATIIGNFTFPPSARKTNDALEKSESAESTAQDAMEQVEADAEKIEAAKQAATDAKANAETANSLAQEASTKASEVHTLANEAKTAAQTAEAKAAEAMTNVATANNEIAAIRAEITAVENDVSTIRADIKGQIQSEVETLTADYAKTTDLTTLEGTLKAEISKSAAELQTTMSETYLAKSDHVTIQANLQTQITQNSELISSSAKAITRLEADTTEAQKAIDAAQSDADAAIAAANEAQTKATTAQAAATEAKSKADAANTALQEAKNDLAEAEENLAAVTNRVDATEEEIAAAQADVAKAQTAVSKAQADATAAQNAATTAKSAADAASAKATEAKNAADAAQADVDKLAPRVTEAETKITQTAEAITSVATRTTNVENKFGNYSTTEQMNAAIKQQADSITSTVSKTYATNSRVDGVEDTADAAASDASTAKSNASTALSTANTANSTANTAKSTADTASSNASTAKSNAATALSTANTAASNASTALTTANQTADKFTWIVKSGTSSSNFTITDRMATLTADKINLNGLVAFSGLNSDAQSKVNTAASDASTAKSNAATALSTANTAKSTADTASSNASTAKTNASTALSTANTAASDASTAKSNASTALSTANANAATISNWCYNNNKTYIDGANIYTGTITAGKIAAGAITTDKIAAGAITAAKLSVTSLSAICATIGGFTIGSNYLANNTSSLGFTQNGVYVGVNGISCGTTFKVDYDGRITMRSYDNMSRQWYKVEIGEDQDPIAITSETDETEGLYITSTGIHRGDISHYLYFDNDFAFDNNKMLRWDNTSDVTARVLGLNNKNILLLGDADNISSIQSYNIIRFANTNCDIGTSSYPSGNHILGNDRYVHCRTTSSTNAKLIGINTDNNIVIGESNSNTNSLRIEWGGEVWRMCTHSSDGVTVVQDTATAAYTKSASANMYMTASGVMSRCTSSSRRYKENISEKLSKHLNPDKLYDLPVVEYVYKEGYLIESDPMYKQKILGFIAEDVADIYPNAVEYNDDGTVEMWNSKVIIPAMLKLIQNQHKTDIQIINRLDSTTERIEALQNQLNEAMLQVASLQKQIDILKAA